MTREDSILTKTWVTNDGRYLMIAEITDDHLRAIRNLLRSELTPGSDEDRLHEELANWMADHVAGAHELEDEMAHDVYRVGWIQLVTHEIARRLPCPA